MASSKFRKYGRLCRPGGLRREYKKLRSLLPGATRSRQLRKKVGVVEAAYQYICELQTALLDKFSTKGIPEDLAGVVRGKVATASDIQALALHLINNSTSAGTSYVRSPFIDAPSVMSPILISPSSSEMENTTVASTSRLGNLDDLLSTASSSRIKRVPDVATSTKLYPNLSHANRLCSLPDAPSVSNNRMPYSESDEIPVFTSRLGTFPEEASTSTEAQLQSRSPSHIQSHAASQSQPSTFQTLSAHKCITLSSLHTVMNTLLPSSSQSTSSSASCSSFSCTQSSSSTSMLIE